MKHLWTGRAVAAVLCASLFSACGGGSNSAPAAEQSPPPATQQPLPPGVPDPAAITLLLASSVYATMAGEPFIYLQPGGEAPPAWGAVPCEGGSGSLEALLDGAPSSAGNPLPVGRHAYVVRFANCLLDGLDGRTYTGTASVAYATADWTEIVATARTDSLRAQTSGEARLADVTSNGSGTWKYTSTASGSVRTYAPAAGGTLVNNLTTNVITFNGGSIFSEASPGTTSVFRNGFEKLEIQLNGTSLVLDGALERTFVDGRQTNLTGEIRVTGSGGLVARFSAVDGQMRTDVFAPLIWF